MTEAFEKAFKHVIGVEGGYVDNKDDPGGETKFGISKRSHPDLDIKNLTLEEAKEIYFDDYWRPSQAERLPENIQVEYFSFAVNAGVRTASRTLQQAINDAISIFNALTEQEVADIAVDGIIGPMTARAARTVKHLLPMAFKIRQVDYYRRISRRKPVFLLGWLNRIFEMPAKGN